MDHLVTVVSRDTLLTYQKPSWKSIILPREIYNVICESTLSSVETQGFMLAAKQEDLHVVTYAQTIGKGSAFDVKADKDKAEAANALIRSNPGFRMMDYHTHTVNTGVRWYDKFSGGDFNSFAKAVIKNPNYMHMLFTPTHVLTFGRDIQGVTIANKSDGFVEEVYSDWDNKYRELL